jgi:hypothetical protein
MVSFERESFLLAPVSKYAANQRYEHQDYEVQFYEYRIDLFAFSELHKLSIAVELKLHNWKRAVEQALLYQLCADMVYIALPSTTIKKVDTAQLIRHKIGLLAVYPSGHCRSVVRPQQSAVILPDYRQTYIELLKGTR